MLDKRLLKCAEAVTSGGIAADIGTDHAKLAVYLVQNGISKRALACDIGEGPLSRARETVEQSGEQNRVFLYLSDGLDSVPDDGITDVICAGMGGELIFDIISRAEFVKARRVNLVLQPMTKAERLRRALCSGGFEIISEQAVSEGRFVYTVINATYSGKPFEPSLFFCYTGALSPDRPDDRRYLSKTADKLREAADGISRGKGSAEADDIACTERKIRKLLEVGK